MIRTAAFIASLLWLSPALAAPVPIVAAESVYADIARQIAGPVAEVGAILTNPYQDPHAFEPSASTARRVAAARIVIRNGLGYDAWMARLLAANPEKGRTVIVVAALLHANPHANPHLWYDPRAAPLLARAVAGALTAADPAARAGIAVREQIFLTSLKPIAAGIATLRARYAGTEIAATEPVFDDMAHAIGLKMLEQGFALAVMNGAEPSIREVAGFERNLKSRRIKVLIVNRQASDPSVDRLLTLAQKAGVPVLAVTETKPPTMSYQQWMLSELAALETALAQKPPREPE
ncbi:MAG: metal ABC transporter solute-binding protein, Zn/Mn family [Acetobacteraceae bacterium]